MNECSCPCWLKNNKGVSSLQYSYSVYLIILMLILFFFYQIRQEPLDFGHLYESPESRLKASFAGDARQASSRCMEKKQKTDNGKSGHIIPRTCSARIKHDIRVEKLLCKIGSDLLLWLNDKRVFAITSPKNQDETPHTFAPLPSWSQGFVPHTTPGCYLIRGQTVSCFREVRATRVRSGSLPDCAHSKWEPTRCGHAQATLLNARPPPPNFISRETSFRF